MNRNYVYAFPSVHGTCHIVIIYNDDLIKSKQAFQRTVDFFQMYDVFGGIGNHVDSKIDSYKEIWFECDMDIYNSMISSANSETTKKMLGRNGFELVFEYPFKEEF